MKSKKVNTEAVVQNEEATKTQNSIAPPAPTQTETQSAEAKNREAFEECEAVLKEHLGKPLDVARALRTINKYELYKFASHETFENYCETRWGISDKYAYRLIRYADVFEHLKSHFSSIGEKTPILPANEAQARPLHELDDPKKIVKAWKKVVKKAKAGEVVTAALVLEAVDKVLKRKPGAESGKTTKPKKPVLSSKVTCVIKWIDEALTKEGDVKSFQSLLERIKKSLQEALAA